MRKSPEYLYLDFLSGTKRKEYLYRYGTDDTPTVSLVRLTFRGERPHTIHVPHQVADNEELINLIIDEVPNAQVLYFGGSGDLDE